jgi:uncharacterized protein
MPASTCFRRTFDARNGGFGEAPKFPRPVALNFLLRYYAGAKSQEALDMATATLREMAKGGMYDQLGGGFHRYSVDARWFVPHFEKMLYDQAQLAVSYVEAFQITGEASYSQTARGILDYVLRDMRDPDGGFYSAEDADSVIDPAHPEEKGEGAFYIWTQAEIEAVAGQPAAEWFCHRFGVEPDGNVRSDPHQEFTGKNILYQAHEAEDPARLAAIIEASGKLLEARGARVRPHLDDKVLTAWNGLMISAFGKAGAVLAEPRYTDAARRAADFLSRRMYDAGTGILLRRYRQGEAAIPGFLDDYAFFAQALLDLYETSFEWRDLELAIRLTEKMVELFEDREHGAFYSTAAGDPTLVMRIKEDYDGAEPSGNSIAVLNLLRLAQITDRPDFRASAARALEAFGSRMVAAPVGVPQMLVAYEFSISKPKQIILVGERDAHDTRQLLAVLHSRFVPHGIVLLVNRGIAPGVGPLHSSRCGDDRYRRTGHRLRLRRLRLQAAYRGRGGVRPVVTIGDHPNNRRTNGTTRSNNAARRSQDIDRAGIETGRPGARFRGSGRQPEAGHPGRHRKPRAYLQRDTVAGYAGVRRADQAVQRRSRQAAQRGYHHGEHGSSFRAEALVRRFRSG